MPTATAHILASIVPRAVGLTCQAESGLQTGALAVQPGCEWVQNNLMWCLSTSLNARVNESGKEAGARLSTLRDDDYGSGRPGTLCPHDSPLSEAQEGKIFLGLVRGSSTGWRTITLTWA